MTIVTVCVQVGSPIWMRGWGMCVCQLRNVYMVMRDWCYSLFYFSDRGILRNGNGPHGYSDHGAWCFSSWERYWLSLASDRPTSVGLGWTKLHSMLLIVDCVLHCLSFCLSVDIFASSSSLFLFALPVICTLFLFLQVCLALLGFGIFSILSCFWSILFQRLDP